jgi:hypothetical protein
MFKVSRPLLTHCIKTSKRHVSCQLDSDGARCRTSEVFLMELQRSLHAGSYDLDVFRIALVAILVLRPASTPFPKSESFFSSSELI